ncbi:MAG TPA: metallophosphoesterase [Blastocatellia bacterium]|nr:metallophosphoesterase [Blastocatellia bacterium]
MAIIAARLGLSLLLIALQFYVLRAMLRGLRSLQLGERREKRLKSVVTALVAAINIPLLFFLVEGFFTPRYVLLYSPPARYEALVRPFAYLFFIWTLGSLLFALASPLVMGTFAAAQFFKKRWRAWEQDATVKVMDLSRRRFLQMGLTAVASMPFAVSAYGAVAARAGKVVERVVVSIKGLPSQLDGFSIVQLSDVHAGLFMTSEKMSEYVKIANDLSADLVALTGDFVATSNSQVAPFLKAISSLKAPRGVYACLGNHDMFTGSEEKLARGFATAGFKLLRNENEYVDVNGAKLNVIGVDYIGRGSKSRTLDQALRGIPLDETTLLLSHAPNTFEAAAKAGIHLTLSGHTHGGQIAFTFGDLIISPASLATMFVAGLFKIGGSHLYVNRGLGTTGPPIRINAPPEITHITLRAERGCTTVDDIATPAFS